MVHGHDLKAEQHGTAQQDIIAHLDAAKAVLHAEQVQPANRDDHAQPEPRIAVPPQKQPEHRDQNDVHRRQEAGLCGGGVQGDADLLGCAGREEQRAAGKPCDQELLALCGRFRPTGSAALPLAKRVKGKDGGDQHQHRQPAAPCQKRISTHPGTGALCHKGCAPDKGTEHQHQGMLGLCVHQPMPSTLSRP